MSATYEISGFDDLFDEIKDMEISDTKKRKALKIAGTILVNKIRPNLPKRTGKYQKELKNTISDFDGEMGVRVNSTRFYDVLEEYGTSKSKKNVGTFEKGVNEGADEAIQCIVKELTK